ncbi:TorF family putative porin [Thermithiobacillus plumbiphilus]|uniref:TorF family putative porin n=1 Tax=Thermithiobacillus plumbiphilus TaxID=1729899 RepID=A0ABU9D9F6_9PROT
MRKQNKTLVSLTLLGLGLFSGSSTAFAEITGNIGAVSNYIFRGFNQTGGGAAVQGGLTYNHESGLSLGYWGSTVDYTVVGGPASYSGTSSAQITGTENDLILSYGGKVGEFGYGVGVIGYLYPQANHNNSAELNLKLAYGLLTFNAFYALQDAYWTNQGDVYTNLAIALPMPNDFTFGANAGYYFFENEGDYLTGGTESSNFTDATVSLSHPLPIKGASMSVNYTIGGKDRYDTDIGDNTWLGLNLAF